MAECLSLSVTSEVAGHPRTPNPTRGPRALGFRPQALRSTPMDPAAVAILAALVGAGSSIAATALTMWWSGRHDAARQSREEAASLRAEKRVAYRDPIQTLDAWREVTVEIAALRTRIKARLSPTKNSNPNMIARSRLVTTRIRRRSRRST